jgi:hypothetical protein
MNLMKYLKLLILSLVVIGLVDSGYTQTSVSFSDAVPSANMTAQAAPKTTAAPVTPAPATEVATAETPIAGATPVGRVVWVKGDSFKALTNNKERVLKKMSVIYLHDRLTTNGQTTAEIVFTDNTLIVFNPTTIFTVDNYSYNASKGKGSVGKSVMSVIEGGFRTITGLIAKKNPPDYSMNTPVATIGVRGTDYRVQLKGGELFIGFNEGKPCVKSKDNPSELCLDSKTPYAKVASANAPPQGLSSSNRPSVFDGDQAEVTPAKIAGFGSLPGSGSGGGSVSSFCISN